MSKLYPAWNAENRKLPPNSLVEVADRFAVESNLNLEVEIDTYLSNMRSVVYKIRYGNIDFKLYSCDTIDGQVGWLSHNGTDCLNSQDAIDRSIAEINKRAKDRG